MQTQSIRADATAHSRPRSKHLARSTPPLTTALHSGGRSRRLRSSQRLPQDGTDRSRTPAQPAPERAQSPSLCTPRASPTLLSSWAGAEHTLSQEEATCLFSFPLSLFADFSLLLNGSLAARTGRRRVWRHRMADVLVLAECQRITAGAKTSPCCIRAARNCSLRTPLWMRAAVGTGPR